MNTGLMPRETWKKHLLYVFIMITAVTIVRDGMSDEQILPSNRENSSDIPSVESVVGWLPRRTESLVVIRAPVVGDLESGDSVDDLIPKYLTAGQTGRIADVFGTKWHDAIPPDAIAFTVEGSCRFRSPKTSGEVAYSGCHIFVLDVTNADEVKKNVKAALSDAKRGVQKYINRYEVTTVDRKIVSQERQFHLVWIEPSVLVIATDYAYLVETLANKQSSAKTSGILDNAKTRKMLADFRNESFLALRTGSGLRDFVFTYTPGKSQSPTFLIDAKEGEEFRRFSQTMWEVDGKLPEIGKQIDGYIELVHNELDKKDEALAFAYHLYFRLGHEFGK